MIDLAMQLLASFGSVVSLWAAGAHKPWAWRFGLVTQIPWLWVTFAGQLWGLLPSTVAFIVVYGINSWKEQRAHAAPPPSG